MERHTTSRASFSAVEQLTYLNDIAGSCLRCPHDHAGLHAEVANDVGSKCDVAHVTSEDPLVCSPPFRELCILALNSGHRGLATVVSTNTARAVCYVCRFPGKLDQWRFRAVESEEKWPCVAVLYRGGNSCGSGPVASIGHPLRAVMAVGEKRRIWKKYMNLATQDVVAVNVKETRRSKQSKAKQY